MKKILLFLFFLLMSIGVWSAENDRHNFSQSFSQLLNNNASIASINIDSQSYPIKEIIISFRYNKTIENAVTMEVSVGGTSWGTKYSAGTGSYCADSSFTHISMSGAIVISFTNNTGSGTGHGTFYVNNICLVEGNSGESPVKYTVTYNSNGGAGTMTDDNEYSSDATVTVLSNTFTRDGYIFNHWDTKADDSGTDYAPGATFSISENITLYAQWQAIPSYTDTTYMCVPFDSLTSDDVFMIIGKKEGVYYAMSNDGGTGNDPKGIVFTPISNFIFTDSTNVLWTLDGNKTDGFIFHPFGNKTVWLYCNTTASSSSNQNLRVGTGERNKFIYGLYYYLETNDTHTTRYLGVTKNHVWHSYISTHGGGEIDGESFYFYKRVPNLTEFHTACVCVFNNAGKDSTWTNRRNWIFGKLPDDSIYGARIDTAVLVDTTHAVAKHVIINQNTGNGKIIIQPNKGLEVDSTIVVSKNNSYHPTTPNDLILESSDAGNASLIFNNSNQNSATVNLYSKATYPGLDGVNADWQYIGTSITSLNALYNYYGSWLYEWVGEPNKWQAVPNGGTMKAWKGYCITQQKEACHETSGQLVSTNNIMELPIDSPYTVVANSWTAPIHISKFADDDFYNLSDKRIYLFNTGFDPGGDGAVHENRYNSPGTYVVIPIHAASYLDKDSLIPSQQGFFVKTTTNGTLKLDYNKLVRTGGSGLITAGALRAPKRVVSDDKPNVLKIYAHGSKFSDRLTILERKDFSTGFDNGWDGDKMSFSNLSPSIYVINEDGSYDEVSAIPDYEGTVLGFKSGSDSICRLTFSYDGDDTWYLNDLVTLTSTLIDSDSEYVFTHGSENDVRFIISETPYAGIATDLDKTNDGANNIHKYLHNGNLYILKNNRIFNAIGSLIQ